ncbi:MAG TPA: hypothetical protein VNV65_09375 [Candidatus Solibacter sp.]|nr:hypothetical protein [Candidatus Solibacter sp.]
MRNSQRTLNRLGPRAPRRAWSAALVGFCLVASGCRLTPQLDLSAKLQGASSDVAFGRQHPPVVPSPSPLPFVPDVNPAPAFPTPLAIEPPPVLPPPVNPCPEAGPFVFPAVSAPPTPTHRPAEAVYPYRASLVITSNPGTPQAYAQKATAFGTVAVKETTAPTSVGDYTFAMEEHFAQVAELLRFHVYPTSVSASTVGGPTIAAGIYLVEQNNLAGGVFRPAPPGVEVMPLPAAPGQPVDGAGTDGTTATTMEINPAQPPPPSAVPPPPTAVSGSLIQDKANVDACGTVLQGWGVHDIGQIIYAGATSGDPFTLDFTDGTEYGGLPLSIHSVRNYTENGVPKEWSSTITIDVTPQNPQAN